MAQENDPRHMTQSNIVSSVFHVFSCFFVIFCIFSSFSCFVIFIFRHLFFVIFRVVLHVCVSPFFLVLNVLGPKEGLETFEYLFNLKFQYQISNAQIFKRFGQHSNFTKWDFLVCFFLSFCDFILFFLLFIVFCAFFWSFLFFVFFEVFPCFFMFVFSFFFLR